MTLDPKGQVKTAGQAVLDSLQYPIDLPCSFDLDPSV